VLKRASGSASDWESWANEHGWRYTAPAPHLAGRFLPDLARRETQEDYLWSVDGTQDDLEFVAFQRRLDRKVKGGVKKTVDWDDHLAVHLPGVVRADLRAMEPAAAFASLGGSLAGRYDFSWHGEDWVLGSGQRPAPVEVERTLRQISSQLALAPAEIWERKPTT